MSRFNKIFLTGICAGVVVFAGEILPGLLTMSRVAAFATGYAGLLAAILALEMAAFALLGVALARTNTPSTSAVRWITGIAIAWTWTSNLAGPLPRRGLVGMVLAIGVPCGFGYLLLRLARSESWKLLWVPIAVAPAFVLGSIGIPETDVRFARPQREDGPNVLVITVDTLRRDLLGCYGNRWVDTPAIDGLAASGIRFDSAWAHVPLTLPSHATLFTGVPPVAHGVHLNGQRTFASPTPTLAQTLQRLGWQTGAFVSAYVLAEEFGLSTGFDVYDDSDGWWVDRSIPRPVQNLVLARVMDRLGLTTSGVLERPGHRVVDHALAWLDEQGPRPWFLWVHLFEPHGPHEADPTRIQKYEDRLAKADADDPIAQILERRGELEKSSRSFAAHLAEIETADEEVGRLLRFLEDRGLVDETLVLLTADHGQAFGEDGYEGHLGSVGNETLAVPAILAGPGLQAGVSGTAVSHVDLLPTLLGRMGIDVPAEVAGRSILESDGTPRVTPAEPHYFESLASAGKNEPRVGLRDARTLLITDPAGSVRYFGEDVTWGEGRDWGHPLDPESPQGILLQNRLREIVTEGSLTTQVDLSESDERALRTLGYLD